MLICSLSLITQTAAFSIIMEQQNDRGSTLLCQNDLINKLCAYLKCYQKFRALKYWAACNFLLAWSWDLIVNITSRFIPLRVLFKWIFCSTSQRFKASTAVLIKWESLRGALQIEITLNCVGLYHIFLVYPFLTHCSECSINTIITCIQWPLRM